jgi:hypothetical protein
MAPKAIMSAIPSRPQGADSTARHADQAVGGRSYCRVITTARGAADVRSAEEFGARNGPRNEFVGPRS